MWLVRVREMWGEREGGVKVRWRMRIRGVRESEKSTVAE